MRKHGQTLNIKTARSYAIIHKNIYKAIDSHSNETADPIFSIVEIMKIIIIITCSLLGIDRHIDKK